MTDVTPPPAPAGGSPEQPEPQQPPPRGGQPLAAYTGGIAQPYPIVLDADYPAQGIDRWRPLVQWLLVIPHLIALTFVGIAAYVAFIGAWFAIVFTRRYPAGIFNFIAGTLRWAVRVEAYLFFMVDRYPAFAMADDLAYPVRLRFDYPEAGIARWRPFVQWLLAIPHFIVLGILGALAYVAVLIGFFAVLFTRTYPRVLWDFLIGFVRWQTRVNAYAYLMTEKYPPFSID